MMSDIKDKKQVSIEEAMKHLKGDIRFATVLQHGTMSVEIYQPIGHDPQQPHEQDELYIIISGSGDFYNNGITKSFQAGDVLFVPAGDEHRFENFTEDLMFIIFNFSFSIKFYLLPNNLEVNHFNPNPATSSLILPSPSRSSILSNILISFF